MPAYRADVRRFTDTLVAQGAQLDRLLDLQKARAPVARVSAGRTKVNLFNTRTAKANNVADLVRRFGIEMLAVHATGRPTPDMVKLVPQLQAEAKAIGGPAGTTLSGIADLCEAMAALPRMWGDRAPVAKGYPEYDPSQPRDTGGRFASSGGGSAAAAANAQRQGMSAHRAELFESYRRKFGYHPPKGMPNQRIEMWIKEKAPSGDSLTNEMRAAIASNYANEKWPDTFKRVTSTMLTNVYNWTTSPIIMDTLVTVALYALASRFLPAVPVPKELRNKLNSVVNIVFQRRRASSGELINVFDDLASMFPRPGRPSSRRFWG